VRASANSARAAGSAHRDGVRARRQSAEARARWGTLTSPHDGLWVSERAPAGMAVQRLGASAQSTSPRQATTRWVVAARVQPGGPPPSAALLAAPASPCSPFSACTPPASVAPEQSVAGTAGLAKAARSSRGVGARASSPGASAGAGAGRALDARASAGAEGRQPRGRGGGGGGGGGVVATPAGAAHTGVGQGGVSSTCEASPEG
jgi:hypothetical protein